MVHGGCCSSADSGCRAHTELPLCHVEGITRGMKCSVRAAAALASVPALEPEVLGRGEEPLPLTVLLVLSEADHGSDTPAFPLREEELVRSDCWGDEGSSGTVA